MKLFSLLMVAILGLSSCSYRNLEGLSPRHQTGIPVMSELEVVCRDRVVVNPRDDHPPLDFMVLYDRLWDVTVYPNYPKYPQPYPEQLCQNGFSTQVITSTGMGSLYTQLEPEHESDTSIRHNLDPNYGAVRVWSLPFLEIDGLNTIATMVSFYPMIFKGHKLPTGSNFRLGKFTTSPYHTKESIHINGREWVHHEYEFIVGRDIPEHGRYKVGDTSFHELYTTQIGKYTFAMLAGYDDGLATNAPAWLNSRRLFLREWLETFEFVPTSQSSEQAKTDNH